MEKLLTPYQIHHAHFSASSQVPKVVDIWKNDLTASQRSRIADSVASPGDHPELFEEGWDEALEREAAALGGEMDSSVITVKNDSASSAKVNGPAGRDGNGAVSGEQDTLAS